MTTTERTWSVGMALFTFVVACHAECRVAKVSDFGFDPEDSTEIIQRALDSGVGTLVFDRQSGPWVTRPLFARSNMEIVFEDGVELVAKRGEFHGIRDYLFTAASVTNLVLRGLGEKGGTFRMWKTDYQDLSKYDKSEWRFTLRLQAVENVLVENMTFKSSGGDGIVLGANGPHNCRNVVIRKCVCDDNHRQGISICSGENVLIEDCVLSNTKGTPPEAGIDFEPDRPNECLSNITLRNVLSINNAGNGADVYSVQMRDFSIPVSITFENFRSIGNRYAAMVCGGKLTDDHIVRGKVQFRNCLFADSKSRGLYLYGLPKGALDVSFDDCIVSNCAAGSSIADVILEAGLARQGASDGVEFGNLKIFQPNERKWFRCGQGAFGPSPENITGDITVSKPSGEVERHVLDAAWRKAEFPVIGDGSMPPPRLPLPREAEVEVVDERPGEMVSLSPVFSCYHPGRYLFFVPKAGPVRFLIGQYAATPGRKANGEKMHIREVDSKGRKVLKWSFTTPGFEGGEVAVNVPRSGFYRMTLPTGRVRTRIYKSSVPIALDFSEGLQIVAGEEKSPFTLWFENRCDENFALLANGDNSYYRFAAEVRTPSGRVAFRGDNEKIADILVSGKAGEAETGLWSATFSPTPKPHYSWVHLDISGVSPSVFLSKEKRWTVKSTTHKKEQK